MQNPEYIVLEGATLIVGVTDPRTREKNLTYRQTASCQTLFRKFSGCDVNVLSNISF